MIRRATLDENFDRAATAERRYSITIVVWIGVEAQHRGGISSDQFAASSGDVSLQDNRR